MLNDYSLLSAECALDALAKIQSNEIDEQIAHEMAMPKDRATLIRTFNDGDEDRAYWLAQVINEETGQPMFSRAANGNTRAAIDACVVWARANGFTPEIDN